MNKIITITPEQEIALRVEATYGGTFGRDVVLRNIIEQLDNQPEPSSISQMMRVYTAKEAGGREYQEFLGELYTYGGENQLVFVPEDDEELEYAFTLTGVRDTTDD